MSHFTNCLSDTIHCTAPDQHVFADRGPIKITPLSLNTKKTWLAKPVIEVENTSRKPIEYLVIEITLPRDAATKEIAPFMLVYGQTPGRESNLVPALQPGAKISLSVNKNACDWVKSQLSAIRPMVGSRTNTRINAVVFGDKTAWFDGLLHNQDPINPSRWLVMRNSAQRDLNIMLQFKFTLASYGATKPQNVLGSAWHRVERLLRLAGRIRAHVPGMERPLAAGGDEHSLR